MQRTVLLSLLCVLVAALLSGTGVLGQSCDRTVVLDGQDEIVLNKTGTTCLQCSLVPADDMNVQWAVNDRNTFVDDISPMGGRHVERGQLVVSNASAFTGGPGIQIQVYCFALGDRENEDVYLEGFIPPVVSVVGSSTVNEGDTLTLRCTNDNIPGLSTLEWLDPQGRSISVLFQLQIEQILRTQSGMYECRLTNQADNSTMSSSVSITIQYIPSVTSEEPLTQLAPLNGDVTLSCVYDSLPRSIVTWFLNGVELFDGSNGVNIVNNDAEDRSGLMLTSLSRASGGNYSCNATNVVGSDTTTVNVDIQVPPDSATELTVTAVAETNLSISWTNNFNGLSPITGVSITVTNMRSGMAELSNMMFLGDSGLGSLVIPNLPPFTEYLIELSVVNVIGPSISVNTTGFTLSLVLEAPNINSFTNLSSTSLGLNWQPPAPNNQTTDAPSSWTVEFLNADGSVNQTEMIQAPHNTFFTFNDLEKGTQYGARVVGSNVRGLGAYSETVYVQTTIDPPSAPRNVSAVGVSAFGLEVFWTSADDDGGRPVTGYYVSYRVTGSGAVFAELALIGAEERSRLIRNGGEPAGVSLPMDLVNSTQYNVVVVAINEAGRGMTATVTATTQSLEEPQKIFTPPLSSDVTNRTSVISWNFPGGDVVSYTVQIKLRINDWNVPEQVRTIIVPGNQTSLLLEDILPESQYDVRIQTDNGRGSSLFSVVATFTTLVSSPPVVSGPGSVSEGTRTVINCTDSVGRDVIWWEQQAAGEAPLPETATIEGNSLVFNNPQLDDGGIYICRVGSVFATYTLIVMSVPTDPTGVSNTVIIAVCVVGGFSVFVFVGVVCLAICCVCGCNCSKSKTKSSKYNVKTKNKGKRSMTWIETSTKFVPNTSPNYSRQPDEVAAFDLPDDIQTHSSFNTMEKQNRIDRGHDASSQPPPYGSSGV